MSKTHQPTIHCVVKYFYPVNAGIEKSVLSTSQQLAAKGWKVVIHTSTDTLTESNVLKRHEQIGSLEIHRYPLSTFGFMPQIPWKEVDVVSLHNFNIFPHTLLLFQAWIHKIRGQKHYILDLTPHGGFTPAWNLFSGLPLILKRTFHQTLGVWLINHSVDIVRAVSMWEAGQIKQQGVHADKIKVIGNGVENIAYEHADKHISIAEKNKIKSLGKYIVTLGRIDPIKNLDTVIKAMPMVDDSIKLVMVGPIGEEVYHHELQYLIHSLGLEKRVIFYGEASGYTKYYLLHQAKVMVHMAMMESFSIAVREGMSQGIVCIVADNSALSELVKNGINGFKIATFNAEALAAKINEVVSEPDDKKIKAIKAEGLTEAKQSTWTVIGQQLGTLYQNELKYA